MIDGCYDVPLFLLHVILSSVNVNSYEVSLYLPDPQGITKNTQKLYPLLPK